MSATTPTDTGGPAREALRPFLAEPACVPPLDPAFRPIYLARLRFGAAATSEGTAVPVRLAIEQPGGAVEVHETTALPDGHPRAVAGHVLCERLARSMLWSRGGSRLWVDGPPGLVEALRAHYESTPEGRFDAATIGGTVFGQQLEVVAAPVDSFPSSREAASTVGGHLDGCRIGFDLGASDRKAAAVIDGRVVFSEEILWDPSREADPSWHFEQIMDSLRRAAAYLPRVDAIGGSAAGIYVDGRVRAASLFRAVPPDRFRDGVTDLFVRIQRAWDDIPFVVMNDGDVTALAGSMQAGVGRLLGIAMGSSEAAGYVTPERTLSSRLNELAFVPIDLSPEGPLDEWSGDRGCGVQYLSQQAVGRLLPPAGIPIDAGASLPERLVLLQELMAGDDDRARRVYETIGVYLGYALLEYRALYDVGHVLLLGRVMTGRGGDVIAAEAKGVLRAELGDPDAIAFLTVSERDKRHGQAVAAASLPLIG
jgi:predicted NBD/HSP70 family sugar kinase